MQADTPLDAPALAGRARSPLRRTAPRDAVVPTGDPCARSADAVLDVVPAVMDALRAAMRRHVGGELSVPQFRCLNFVALEPGCTIGAVAAFLGVTMPTASAMIDRLVRAALVRPITPAEDRRRSHLHLTAAGRAQLQQIRGGARDELRRTLAALTPQQLRTLDDGIEMLRVAFLAP